MASGPAHPAVFDVLQALTPIHRRSVFDFAKRVLEKDRLARPKLPVEFPELVNLETVIQIEAAKRFAVSLLRKGRSAAYLKRRSLTELVTFLDVSQRRSFVAYTKTLVPKNESASRTREAQQPEPTLNEILDALTLNQVDAVQQYAVGLLPSGRIDVASEIAYIVKTLATAQGNVVIQTATQMISKRQYRNLRPRPTIADILVLLNPKQHDSLLRIARQFLTSKAVAHSNRKMKTDNPNYESDASPRWLTVQGGLANGK